MNILDLVFPERCVSCSKIGSYICEKCHKKIEYNAVQICPVCGRISIDGYTHIGCRTRYGLDGMFSAVQYKGPVKKAIRQIKYRYVSDIIETLGSVFLENFPRNFVPLDILVSVPLHHKREKERGFNQSLLLAKFFSKSLVLPVLEDTLIRVRYTTPQFDLGEKERKNNLKDAFMFAGKKNISGKNIGLVDDVSTTGTTLSECSRVLKQNGAKSVWGLVIAHG